MTPPDPPHPPAPEDPGAEAAPTQSDPGPAAADGPRPLPGTAELDESAVDAVSRGTGRTPPGPATGTPRAPARTGATPGSPLRRPPATRVIVVANQKGGVGKTTSTVNLAAALAMHGQRVLIVDLDPQGNASTALGVAHGSGTPSVYDVVIDGKAVADVVQHVAAIPGLRIVPATIDLAGAEIELVPMVARETRLRRALRTYLAEVADAGDGLDFVLVDCPPSLGLLTLNAFVAAREVLIPIQCEYYALEGLGQLVQTVDMVRTHLNEDLAISAILLTMHDSRTRLSSQVAGEVRKYFGDRVLATSIPRSVRISEAPSYGQTVLTYDPVSSGALSYVQAARELSASLPG